MKEYDAAPADAKPDCKPVLLLTLPSLVAQTAEEMAKFSTQQYIVVFHAASEIPQKVNITRVSSRKDMAPLWDTRRRQNLQTVIVSLFDTFANYFGPVVQTN